MKEKSSALEAAELIKEELVKSQMSGASLQDMLFQKDRMLEKLEDIILQSGIPEISTSEDVSDLESRLGWLTKSFYQAKAEIGKLQDEITRTNESLNEAEAEIGALQVENSRIRDTAASEMDQLVASLSTVLVEKDYFKMELDNSSHRYEAIVQREHQAVSEKEHMLKTFLEASGVTVDNGQPLEAGVLVEQCLATMKERSSSTHESSEVKDDFLSNLAEALVCEGPRLGSA